MDSEHRIKQVREAYAMCLGHCAIAIETPRTALLDYLEPRLVVPRLVVPVEHLLADLSLGIAIYECQSVGTVPLYIDYSDVGIVQDAADAGARSKVFESHMTTKTCFYSVSLLHNASTAAHSFCSQPATLAELPR